LIENSPDLYLLFKIPMGTRRGLFGIYTQFVHAPSECFASPAVSISPMNSVIEGMEFNFYEFLTLVTHEDGPFQSTGQRPCSLSADIICNYFTIARFCEEPDANEHGSDLCRLQLSLQLTFLRLYLINERIAVTWLCETHF
jgi:hypothetical protein